MIFRGGPVKKNTLYEIEVWNCCHFRQLRTWVHDNHCYLGIKSDTGQHSQFLRCLSSLFDVLPNVVSCSGTLSVPQVSSVLQYQLDPFDDKSVVKMMAMQHDDQYGSKLSWHNDNQHHHELGFDQPVKVQSRVKDVKTPIPVCSLLISWWQAAW